VRTPIDAEATNSTLSLYVTCRMLDDRNAEYETSASMLAAINLKCQNDRIGERGVRAAGHGILGKLNERSGRTTKFGMSLYRGIQYFPPLHSNLRCLRSVHCHPCRHYRRTRESTGQTCL